MPETEKAHSKEAMEAIRAVRCSHEPVNCDFCVAAALEAFAAERIGYVGPSNPLGYRRRDE